MKKFISFLSLLIFMLSFCTPALAAIVPAQTFPDNDAVDYTPPEGCILYQIPNSDIEGTHTVTFDDQGTASTDGSYIFTVVTGTIPRNDYTQVLAWSSNFPIYAVIVNGDDAFNLYQYDSTVRGDTDLLSLIDSLGLPSDVNNVSIVLCPDTFTTDPALLLPTGPQSSILIVNTIFQIISTILLGVMVFLMILLLFGSTYNIFGSCISRFHKKSRKTVKHSHHIKKDIDYNIKKDKDCDHKKPEDDIIEDKDCEYKEDKKCHHDFCEQKIDPGSGYSLDCDTRNSFPYTNNYHNYF
jgi:hypothetical protein